jgi:hypothetical protein
MGLRIILLLLCTTYCCDSHNKPSFWINLSEFYRKIFNMACTTGHHGLGGVAFGHNSPALPSRARVDERIMIMLGQRSKLLKLFRQRQTGIDCGRNGRLPQLRNCLLDRDRVDCSDRRLMRDPGGDGQLENEFFRLFIRWLKFSDLAVRLERRLIFPQRLKRLREAKPSIVSSGSTSTERVSSFFASAWAPFSAFNRPNL